MDSDNASLKSARIAVATVSPHSLRGEGREHSPESRAGFKLYKRRWIGLVAVTLLNVVSGMSLVWFGPIANNVVDEFGFSIDEVNWLSNVVNATFIPFSVITPHLYARIGMRRSCYVGAVLFVVSAWVRYAGTANSLSRQGAYALILLGQLIAGIAQPVFQVLVPNYSEKWFDLKTRITATMIMSLGNPVGNAIGQLISPLVGTPSESILIMGIIFTAVTPLILLVGNAPPTPPTHSGSSSPTFSSFVRAFLGKEARSSSAYTTLRQRIDFVIITVVFGVLVAVINVFSVLSAQIMEPYGLMGAVLLLAGLVAAAATAPIFDRVLSHHLALSTKFLCPVIGAGWLSLIWAVKTDDTAGLFAIMAMIGAASLTLLPVALELAVEVTKNADASSAILWCSSNVFALIFTLSEGALRAGGAATPPYNMRRALVFQGCWVCAAVALVMLVQGRQTRREADERAAAAVRGSLGASGAP
ncbi:major facilitator superfamily domain-containing protein [Amylocystis lapponica]|nr:major facilitator superfamily domain-containing protein [Amylocystis lapponica]